jgi:hypothetical protein
MLASHCVSLANRTMADPRLTLTPLHTTGELIDNQLLAIVQDRIKTGQTVDDYAMREILVDLLTAVGKETMLRENGGTREC